MYILGIACFYHDSAACLLKDGEVVAAVEEERFTRKKHTSDFPGNSIQYCLDLEGIKINDIDYITFYELPENKFNRLISTHLYYFPKTFEQFKPFIAVWMRRNLMMEQIVRKELGYENELVFVDHHLAHAGSAFLPSGFDEAVILTVDGVGEWTTTALGVGRGNKIELNKEIRFPNSLGLLYSAVTYYLGFKVNTGEGKVMGLASYGKPTMIDKFEKIIHIGEDGSFRLDMDYFTFHKGLEMVGEKFDSLFRCRRDSGGDFDQLHYDMAATLQFMLEKSILAMVNHAHKETGLTKICIGGGVGLNSVANGRIIRETPFRDIFIQPAASDAGSSLGSAVYLWNCILGNEKRWRMKNAYLGHEATNEEAEACLKKEGLKYEKLSEEELINRVAALVADNKMVGWYQGRMEFGPRALGNRTILANPGNPEMKDILNSRVKFREWFRPYAASIMEEGLSELFDCDYTSPFMLLVYDVLEEKKSAIPSVTHVDGTCRTQSVNKEQNPRYYRLIKKFRDLTGIPAVLNTSFNIRGEPIIRDAADAVKCYLNTDLEALALCDCLLIKE